MTGPQLQGVVLDEDGIHESVMGLLIGLWSDSLFAAQVLFELFTDANGQASPPGADSLRRDFPPADATLAAYAWAPASSFTTS